MTAVETPSTLAAKHWIRRPIADVLMAFAWVPVAGWAVWVRHDPDALAWLTTAVLFVSFCHQPVTLPLIYGDLRHRRSRGPLLVVAPVVAVGAVFVGLSVSLVLVALVSALWNAHHTLRQRYGIVRVYGRKVGQGDGQHEQALLFSWFALSLSVCVAGGALTDRLGTLPVGIVNQEIVDLLVGLRPLAVLATVVAAVVAVTTTARWMRLEVARPIRNPAKHVYLAGAGVLFLLAPIDPIAAFLGFMAAHSVEYFFVVERTLPKHARVGSVLATVARPALGPALFLAVYVLAVLVAVQLLHGLVSAHLFLSVYLAFGVLHFVFDGMIWKLRTPAVAAQFDILH